LNASSALNEGTPNEIAAAPITFCGTAPVLWLLRRHDDI